jgi:hypothetical protein
MRHRDASVPVDGLVSWLRAQGSKAGAPLRRRAALPKPLDGRNHHLTAKPADIHLLDSTE